ncbi:MAG TPA: hypothetical protein VF814_21360 [Casimicrobiaceae bacterium]
MRGKLNLFQAMMLRWRELHPYVAVHMVSVDSPLDRARLEAQIERRLEAAGLTGLVLDRRRRRFEFRGGPAAIELTLLSGGADPHAVACAEIERQLNWPFPPEGASTPFRFFAVDQGTSFQLGLAYDHFIAGGDSIAVLLEKLVAGYARGAAEAPAPWTPRRYPKTYGRLFLQDLGYALRGLARLPSMAASCKRSCRAPCRTDAAATNAFLSFRVPASELASVLRTAKTWGVTFNDLCLALLLRALARLVPRRAGQARSELGVASIVNLRAEFESDAGDTFGQFLASLRVSHPVPHEIGPRQLALEVHAQTERIKKEKLYLQTLIALAWTGLAWRFLTLERRRRFLAKHYAIWAGMTSLHVDPLWRTEASGARTEYARAVPTGPLAPIVFALTTFRGALHLGVSYRVADLTRESAQSIAAAFLDQIDELLSCSHERG